MLVMMHRWHLQRLFRWLVPTLLFAVGLCALMARQKSAGGGLDFVGDAAYVNMAVARTLIEKQVYGLDGDTPITAGRDVLWRLAVALAGWVSGNVVTGAYLTAALCALLTLLLTLRLARFLFPFPPFMTYTAVLLLAAPGVLVSALDGTSTPLATMLVTAAVLLHVEGLYERRMPLPMGSALLVGLLAWIRLEFLILWPVFFLHAVVLSFFRSSAENTPMVVVTRGLTGLLMTALCIFPLLAWNFRVVQVPWPQVVGAPFTLDTWLSATPGGALAAYGSMSLGAVPSAFGRLGAVPFLAGRLEGVMTWFGACFIAGLSIWRQEERPYTIVLFLLLLLPPCLAFAYPYLGWDAAPAVFETLTPLAVITAAFGFFRVPFLVEELYRKWRSGLPSATGFRVWWVVMGSILLIVAVLRTGMSASRRTGELVELGSLRQAAGSLLESDELHQALCATDSAGWLAFTLRTPVLDVTGECTPQVLTCLDSRGQVDGPKLRELLVEQEAVSVVLWDPARDALAEGLSCERLTAPGAAEDQRPRVCRLSGSGAF